MTGSRRGQTLCGCALEQELGRGAMGAVYLAREPSGRRVAIKVLLQAGSALREERFRREAQALAALHHPGIVRLLRADLDHTPPCLVMEFVEGESLDRLLESGSLSLDERLRVFEEICRALHKAHQPGSVPRDL